VPDLTPLRSLTVRGRDHQGDAPKTMAIGDHGAAPNGRL
jgi:hypothetical protein